MTVEDMIKDVNSLPVQAQQQVANFIDFIKLKYPDINKDIKKKELTIEDSFGMFSVDKPISLEGMENRIAPTMQKTYGADATQNKPKSEISKLFGLFTVDKPITEDEIQEAIETMGGKLDSP